MFYCFSILKAFLNSLSLKKLDYPSVAANVTLFQNFNETNVSLMIN